jgi:hypothetical protein
MKKKTNSTSLEYFAITIMKKTQSNIILIYNENITQKM